MGIFLIFIPLIIFIVAEGFIIWFLISIIISSLMNYGFSSSTVIGDAYPALKAILYVFLLMTAIGVSIYLYIKFTLKPALAERKLRSEEEKPNNIRRKKRRKRKKSKKPIIILIVIGLIIAGAAVYVFIIQRDYFMPLIFGDDSAYSDYFDNEAEDAETDSETETEADAETEDGADDTADTSEEETAEEASAPQADGGVLFL